MEQLWPYLGDLHAALANHPALAGTILIACAMVCGLIVGLEREKKDKPAGLRTVALISTGSTIFTLASVYGAAEFNADRTRIAAQIVTGIGFLGAGAIIRERGRVIGLTTGATIWAVAAIGVLVGLGYAAAGLALSILVVALLIVTAYVEPLFVHPCQWRRCRIIFDPARGKTRLRVRRLLNRYHVPEKDWQLSTEGEHGALDICYCEAHSEHWSVLLRLIGLKEVLEVRELGPAGAARDQKCPGEAV